MLQAALTLVVIPLLLWGVSALWEATDRHRVEHEELQKSETALLESITGRVEGFVTLRSDLWKAHVLLESGCQVSAMPATDGCDVRYRTALDTLDAAVVDLSWRIDSLPVIAPDSYAVLTQFKGQYWHPCRDDEGAASCGYRQRVVRVVHGIGLATGQAALKTCPDVHAPEAACKNSEDVLQKTVLAPVELDVNAFFCMVAADIKNTRVAAFKRRSQAVGGDFTLDELTTRLEGNLRASACASIVRNWQAVHPQVHLETYGSSKAPD